MLKGFIFWWWGTSETIPHGWYLCNGTCGTPDLRNKWILGAGGSYPVGSTGGSATHNHTLDANNHDHQQTFTNKVVLSGAAISFLTDSIRITGSTDPVNNLPPYRALYPIMQVA